MMKKSGVLIAIIQFISNNILRTFGKRNKPTLLVIITGGNVDNIVYICAKCGKEFDHAPYYVRTGRVMQSVCSLYCVHHFYDEEYMKDIDYSTWWRSEDEEL